MKAPVVAYIRAETSDHAVALLRQHGEDAKLLAGGQSLLPMLNLRLTRPSVLVDIGGIPGLDGITADADTVEVGALTTHHDMGALRLSNPVGAEALRAAAGHIGHYPIRVRGTVGGSLAHADSTSEWALMALAMDAVVLVTGPTGDREVAASGFFQGFFTTDLEPDEMIVGVRFGRAGARARLEEHARRRGDFAIVAAASSVRVDGGRCVDARIALGGVASMPIRVHAAERLLRGQAVDDEAARDELLREVAFVCSREVSPGSDNHASEAYRRRLAATLVDRSLRHSLDGHAATAAASS